MNPRIVSLAEMVQPENSAPAQDRLIAGDPRQQIWNHFTDATGQFFAGRCSSTRGTWHVRYTENELCVLTAGRVVITSDAGERTEFGPGSAFIVPAGFSGSWEVVEPCTKIYAVFETRT